MSIRSSRRKCEACGSGSDLHVHHMTYERLFRERLSDLKLLCKGCHYFVHNFYDANKITLKQATLYVITVKQQKRVTIVLPPVHRISEEEAQKRRAARWARKQRVKKKNNFRRRQSIPKKWFRSTKNTQGRRLKLGEPITREAMLEHRARKRARRQKNKKALAQV